MLKNLFHSTWTYQILPHHVNWQVQMRVDHCHFATNYVLHYLCSLLLHCFVSGF